MRTLLLAAVLALVSACATGPSEAGWTGNNAQPFDTAVAACNQTSYNIEANFITCMAGRGWTKKTGD